LLRKLKREFLALKIIIMLIIFSVPMSLQASPELLLQNSQSWDGSQFSYVSGEPEISSVKLSLVEGVKPPFHCHPVPTMGFIAKGKVLLENHKGKTQSFKQGDSVIEIMKGLHRGYAISSSAEIIVFYAGVKGIPNTVFPEDTENFAKYCQKHDG
jgi:hypothetical protein